MNDYRGFYENPVYETEAYRQEKRKTQKKVFSRVFVALFVYLLSFQLIAALIYVLAPMLLTAEQYSAFEGSTVAQILISSGVQYLIAFPIFLLITRGMRVSEIQSGEKLAPTDMIIFLAIAEAMMFLGNMIGTMLNSAIGGIIGKMPENGVSEIVENTPLWLILLIMVIAAPVVEEIIFRKVMIDRLSVYGDRVAIIFSAAAFGLMHGNLYQLFYATLLGLLLGYIYTKTRDVRYTIILHAIINFLGSVVALPVQRASETFGELYNGYFAGESVNALELITSGIISYAYTSFTYGLIISGVIAVIHLYKKREITISHSSEIFLPSSDLTKGGAVNVGAILFLLLTFTLMILNLL